MLFAGIDLGSTSTKAVLMDGGGTPQATGILPSGKNFAKSAETALNQALEQIGASMEEVVAIVTTGYGRYISGFKSMTMSEITCCGRGSHYLKPGARTIIDIGGQDSKAIKVDHTGKVVNFTLNDKCAAGTGRFLERIAVSLELGMDEMAALSVHSETTVPISSTCTIFAETEVISRISNGEPIESIVRGLHHALATRIYTLVVRLNIEKDILACGGGAKNAGLVKELRDLFGNIVLPSGYDPRLVPAIGAALIARERHSGNAGSALG
jgi:predicted CoA-substrate-specific enzyme activase